MLSTDTEITDTEIAASATVGVRSPLHIACRLANYRMAEMLLDVAADADACDERSETP